MPLGGGWGYDGRGWFVKRLGEINYLFIKSPSNYFINQFEFRPVVNGFFSNYQLKPALLN